MGEMDGEAAVLLMAFSMARGWQPEPALRGSSRKGGKHCLRIQALDMGSGTHLRN